MHKNLKERERYEIYNGDININTLPTVIIILMDVTAKHHKQVSNCFVYAKHKRKTLSAKDIDIALN